MTTPSLPSDPVNPGMVNEWTRDDLPEVPALRQADDDRGTGVRSTAFDIALDVVVEHLNRAHPKPATGLLSSAADCVLESAERVKTAEADRDRWRRAHSIVEAERDQARAERDEWKARAEKAEARTAPAVTRKLVYDAVGAVYDVNGRRGPWPGVEPITDAVCHLFGIETAPDPAETLAVQIEDATRRAVRQACETLAPVAAGLEAEAVEKMLDITEASRRLARRVLAEGGDRDE